MFFNLLHNSRNYNHDVKMYLLTSVLLGFSYFGFVAVLLNLYLLRLGYDPTFIGLVNAGAPIAFASCSVPAGMLGKRFGSRRTIIVGITVLALSIGVMPLAEWLPQAWRNSGFVVARLLTGLGWALYIVNTNPYLVAATNDQDRNEVFSLQAGLLPAAGFLGSAVSGFLPGMMAGWLDVGLSDPAPYRYPLLMACLILLPAAALLFTTSEAEYDRKPTPEDDPETSATKSSRTLLGGPAPYLIIAILAITATTRMAGEGAARTFFNVYLDDAMGISTATIGIVLAIGNIIAGPAALVAPWLVSRSNKVTTVVMATVGISISLLLMAFIPHWTGVSLGLIGITGMLSITRAITNVIYMEIVKADWRSLTSGVTSAAMGLGFASITLGGGYIIEWFGYQALFAIGAVSVAFSALLFWGYFRTPRGEYAQATGTVGAASTT
ncbi:MAG: MFS transporter [Chloroflexota bacterium]